MTNPESYKEKALKYINTADHILTQTYPMVNEPKILLSVINNLKKAVECTVEYILSHERIHKRIPPYHNNYDSKMNAFKHRITDRYHINIKYITLIEELRDITEKHKKSPVEFSRKEEFVICSEGYKLRKISVAEMKNYIRDAKIFLKEMDNIVRKND
jgi:hypothetical protein